MNPIKNNTLVLMSKMINSTLERKELNLFIDKSYRKSIAILKSKYENHLSSGLLEDEEIRNIAMDSIVPLFLINKEGEYGLIKSIQNWNHSIDTENESDYFLFTIISRRVEQTISDYLKQKDPVFEKIYNTLNVSIKKNNFRKVRYFGSVYVLDEFSSKISGKVISPEDFNLIPDHFLKLKQKKLFDELFKYLIENGNYCPALPFNELVYRVKLFYSNIQSKFIANEESLNTSFIFKELVDLALDSVKSKLESHYVASEIISLPESIMIFGAFKNISNDMLTIGAYDTLYKYIHDYDESVTKEVFYLKYRNIMKYLLLDLKLKIGENLR